MDQYAIDHVTKHKIIILVLLQSGLIVVTILHVQLVYAMELEFVYIHKEYAKYNHFQFHPLL
jgi:hypothetical protein